MSERVAAKGSVGANGTRWHRRARKRFGHSLKARMVVLFLLLALAMAGAFSFGMQKAMGVGWRDAFLPLVNDYIDRVATEIGSPPSVERAQRLTQRLPISIRIAGPQINWQSEAAIGPHRHFQPDDQQGAGLSPEQKFWQRTSADGHRITFGLSVAAWDKQPRLVGWATLAVLLALTALAYWRVRRLLAPLDDIRAAAQRFGAGHFAQPIPLRRRDELGDLASTVNTMANSIHQMLEAKRGLLLAISHELRSPLTRARLNTELLPEEGDTAQRRQALLRDLQEMADLVTDLLESERLGQGHAALHLEPTDLLALAHDVVAGLAVANPVAVAIKIIADNDHFMLALDRIRMKLMLRNLLDNALHHAGPQDRPPELQLTQEGHTVRLLVRDYGPGVEESVVPQLAQAFYRPDASRTRSAQGPGGTGLGLHLCKLVAQAHGGSFLVKNAQPGLAVEVVLTQP